MITKGQIVSLPSDASDNTIAVRIPYFESTGVNDKKIFKCTVCTTPGIVNGFKIGDTVFVEFEDDRYESPIIIGVLFKDANSIGTSYAHLESLVVDDSVQLPTNGKLGSVTMKDIEAAVNQIKNDTIDNSPFVTLIGINSMNSRTMNDASVGAIPVANNEIKFRFRLEHGLLCVGDKIQITKRKLVTKASANKPKRYVQRACMSIDITNENVNDTEFTFTMDVSKGIGENEFNKLWANIRRGGAFFYEPCQVRVRRPLGDNNAKMFNCQSIGIVIRVTKTDSSNTPIDWAIILH